MTLCSRGGNGRCGPAEADPGRRHPDLRPRRRHPALQRAEGAVRGCLALTAAGGTSPLLEPLGLALAVGTGFHEPPQTSRSRLLTQPVGREIRGAEKYCTPRMSENQATSCRCCGCFLRPLPRLSVQLPAWGGKGPRTGRDQCSTDLPPEPGHLGRCRRSQVGCSRREGLGGVLRESRLGGLSLPPGEPWCCCAREEGTKDRRSLRRPARLCSRSSVLPAETSEGTVGLSCWVPAGSTSPCRA